MNRSIFLFVLAGLAACPTFRVLAQAPAPGAPKTPAPIIITNAPTDAAKGKNGAAPYLSVGLPDVVRMHQAGVDESVLLAYVQSSTVAYHPSAKEVIYLRDMGLSQNVITAMLRRGGELRDKATEMDREERNRAVPAQLQPPPAAPPSSTANPSATGPAATAPGQQPTVVYQNDTYPTYSYPTYVAGYGGGYPYYSSYYPYYPYYSYYPYYGYGYGCYGGYYRPYCGSYYYGHGGYCSPHGGIYVTTGHSGHSSAWNVGVGVGFQAGAKASGNFSHPTTMSHTASFGHAAGVTRTAAVGGRQFSGGGGGMHRR